MLMVEISSRVDDVLKKDSITSKALSLVPYTGNFWRYYRLLNKSQWWSRARLEEYQLQQLNRLLNHAYENVPYYRRVFDELGLKPKDIQDTRDLQKLPYLTKEIIRSNPDDFRARNYPESRLERVRTGGSTGTPLSFYYERGVTRAIEWAFIKSLWDRIDYHFADKCIVLRGLSLGPDRLWQPTFFGRWLTLSSYRMTDQYLPRYVKKIRQYRPRFIQGYPSSITILARHMKARKVEPFRSLRAVICASENLYPEQKKLFEDVFQCRVYSFYGLTERVALAGACEHSDHYHVAPEYGVLELAGPDGREVKGDGRGVIVGYRADELRHAPDPLQHGRHLVVRAREVRLRPGLPAAQGRGGPAGQRVHRRQERPAHPHDGPAGAHAVTGLCREIPTLPGHKG